MTTHPTQSKIEAWKRPSGGLYAEFGEAVLDWEPEEGGVIPWDAIPREFHIALRRHITRQK